MKPTVEQIGSLLGLRRDIRPEEGYWQDFLCEFHHRQRVQAMEKTGMVGRLQTIFSWLSDLGPAKWAYGAGVAYAAVTVTFFLIPKEQRLESLPAAPVRHETMVMPSLRATEQLDELDLSPEAQGKVGEQAF
ncbi:MAG: hypothetical protein QM627_13005 [Luteolibacter sp.]